MSSLKNISLFIPRVLPIYDEEYISNIFENKQIGKVKNIDFVPKIGQNNEYYNAIYVHFEHWYNTTNALEFFEDVLNPNTKTQLMYEKPWYWIVLENKAKKFNINQRKECINLNTPEINIFNELNIPSTPQKISYKDKLIIPNTPIKLFDDEKDEKDDENILYQMELHNLLKEAEECNKLDEEMDECEKLMDKEEENDQYLNSFDSRYIQILEQENYYLKNLVNNYYNNCNYIYV